MCFKKSKKVKISQEEYLNFLQFKERFEEKELQENYMEKFWDKYSKLLVAKDYIEKIEREMDLIESKDDEIEKLQYIDNISGLILKYKLTIKDK